MWEWTLSLVTSQHHYWVEKGKTRGRNCSENGRGNEAERTKLLLELLDIIPRDCCTCASPLFPFNVSPLNPSWALQAPHLLCYVHKWLIPKASMYRPACPFGASVGSEGSGGFWETWPEHCPGSQQQPLALKQSAQRYLQGEKNKAYQQKWPHHLLLSPIGLCCKFPSANFKAAWKCLFLPIKQISAPATQSASCTEPTRKPRNVFTDRCTGLETLSELA